MAQQNPVEKACGPERIENTKPAWILFVEFDIDHQFVGQVLQAVLEFTQ